MRLPDFLIIGAMKSGTTSLFFDLATHPAVFVPSDKEPLALAEDAVLSPAGRRAYASLFDRAGADQLCGEASTGYSKLPDIGGVPERAHRLVGRNLKVLYLVREPVARIMSHHHHELTYGTVKEGIDQAVLRYPWLIDYTRYAMQIEPWLERFGDGQVKVLRFESYVADRRAVTAAALEHLGLDPVEAAVDPERVFNRSSEALRPAGWFWRFSRGALYRSSIRPWLSRRVRSRLRRMTLQRAPPRPAPPSLATIDYILDQLGAEVGRLQRLIQSDEPLWDLAEVRSRFLDASDFARESE